jgi:hypothetical protein
MVARKKPVDSCRTCRFFGPLPSHTSMTSLPMEGTMGACCRYPPVMCYDDALNAEFPVVHSSMWCGEYDHGENRNRDECESF